MTGNVLTEILKLHDVASEPNVPIGYTALFMGNDHVLRQKPYGQPSSIIGPPNTSFPGLYGDGVLGDVVLNSNTTLLQDMYYANLTINAGITLTVSAFRVFVKGTLVNNGTIAANGTNGNGSNGGGAYGTSGTLGLNQAGGNGAVAGAGAAPTATTGLGGNGGAGGSGTLYPSTPGAIATLPVATAGSGVLSRNLWNAVKAGLAGVSQLNLYNGGGAGAGGSSDSIDAIGGGGGSGGCVIFIAAKKLTTKTGGSIVASGGNGASASGGGGGGSAGGGGGGGGGVVTIITENIDIPSGVSMSISAPGGIGGAPVGIGTRGKNGLPGLVEKFVGQGTSISPTGGTRLFDTVFIAQRVQPAKSVGGTAIIYADSTSGLLRQSVNGNSWANLGSPSDAGGFPGLYGTGVDGDIVIASDTTMINDMYYNSLVVNPGVRLSTANFRIFCKNVLTVNGTITSKSIAGVEDAVGLNGGTFVAAATLGNGANGGSGTSSDSAGANGGSTSNNLCNTPVCRGGSGGTAGGADIGGSAGTITAAAVSAGAVNAGRNFTALTGGLGGINSTTLFRGGSGGGGGGNAVGAGGLGASGGGGAGGGVIVISARNIAGTGTITAPGGNGANAVASGNNSSGGGGGGGGGVIIIATESRSASVSLIAPGGNPGSGAGALGGSGLAGNNGIVILQEP